MVWIHEHDEHIVRLVSSELGSIGCRSDHQTASHVKEIARDTRNQHDQHTLMTDWLGADCPVDYLNVWFPTHWAPLVFKELQDREAK